MSPRSLTTTALAEVELPTYDRSQLRVGIVHLGVGGFHRAHAAWALDELMRQGLAQDWAICGVGLLPGDSVMGQVLHEQDMLYTLVEKAPDGGRTARVIGSIVDYLFAPADPEAVLERMADPQVRIVSMTITEGGYNISPVTGAFDLEQPDVAADLVPGAVPATMFGIVTEALRRRRDRGIPSFTVMSCDNMQENGHVTRRAVLSFARAQEPELADWIEARTAFPSSMVDRITPATTDTDRAETTRRFGVEDGWPVVTEPFFQWVLEDSFVAGRPPLERAGVQLVSDVEPYELMKLRLLNASHQLIAYLGLLSGYRFAHEAARDPAFVRLLLAYMTEEAIPTLRPVPGVDLADYTATLVERFANAEIRDTLARLATDGSDRIPKFLLPVVHENLRSGGPVRLAAAGVASWARHAEGVDEHGAEYPVADRLAGQLTAAAPDQRQDRLAFLRQRELFGNLVDEPRFTAAYAEALDSLLTRGAHATVTDLVPDPAAAARPRSPRQSAVAVGGAD